MPKQDTIIKGTFILTMTGFVSRLIGFFYRIFLSYTFGEEAVGLYQLIFPIFALCFSLTTSGVETALSRTVAKKIAEKKKKEAHLALYSALFLSFSSSVCVMILLQHYASWITRFILRDSRCLDLLRAMSYALPFSSIHSCICGYYFGMRHTKTPAVSQLIEQVVRVASVCILCSLMLSRDSLLPLSFAVYGLCFGEIASSFYCVIRLTYFEHCSLQFHFSLSSFVQRSYSILRFSLPLTGSRVLLNILQSIEAVAIPASLQLSGCTSFESLRIYGVLTGMALPCILCPSALTNSVSTMLLPAIAEYQTGAPSSLLKLIRRSAFCVLILGFSCTAFFLLAGPLIGQILFHSISAGKFIMTLSWICPFLYTNNTLLSILNGLGKTSITFFIHCHGLSVRIFSVFFLVPQFGISGYLFGLLASQLFVFFLSSLQLRKFFLP